MKHPNYDAAMWFLTDPMKHQLEPYSITEEDPPQYKCKLCGYCFEVYQDEVVIFTANDDWWVETYWSSKRPVERVKFGIGDCDELCVKSVIE